MGPIDPTMSAAEAAEALGVSAATLYAYVSRGLVRSEADGRSRARRYHRADVEALIARKANRREPDKVAEAALNFGAPVLDSALSLIQDGRLYYRGLDAATLADSWSVERLAGWLWTGDEAAPLFDGPAQAMSPRLAEVERAVRGLPLVERWQVLLPIAGAEDFAAYDVRPEAVPHTGARLLRLMGANAAGAPIEGPIAGAIAEAWSPGRPEAAEALRAALVLSADHELNVSAFTARCVASAGSTPYAAVVAGLSALQGPRHGGHSDRVEALFAEVGEPDSAHRVLASRLRRGDEIPGFGHPLYPTGDPRGRALLDWAARVAPDAPGLALGRALATAGQDILGANPTIDFGLVTLSRALGWPRGTPIALFALGRSIGWIAHAIEQYATDRLIRPRARYTGPAPEAP